MPSFGLNLVPRMWSISEIVSIYKLAEKNKFDYAWMGDYPSNRDVFSTLTIVAMKTQRIKLGTCVTNPYMRHPAVISSAIASLNEISENRAVLGLGAGEKSTLGAIGIDRSIPHTAIKESVEVIRNLLKGEEVNYEGKFIKLSKFKLYPKPSKVSPIYIGAIRPKLLQLAGQIADGVIIDASHPLEVKLALGEVRKGAVKEGRDVRNLDLATNVIFSMSDDLERAREKVKRASALITSNSPHEVLKRHGINLESVEKLKNALYSEGLEKACPFVTTEMIKAFSISGDRDYCIDAIDRLIKTGLTHIIFGNVETSIEHVKKQVNLVGRKILPHFVPASSE